jgi:hypothetical protein
MPEYFINGKATSSFCPDSSGLFASTVESTLASVDLFPPTFGELALHASVDKPRAAAKQRRLITRRATRRKFLISIADLN